MQKPLVLLAALAAIAVLGGSASAQTPPPPPPAPPAHQGVLSRMFHPRMHPGQTRGSFGSPGLGTTIPMRGGAVGNKNTRVYHLAGDKGAMPAAQNRVYFASAAAAEAAGYRRAGGSRSTAPGRPRMHGSPRTGMPLHGMNGQPMVPSAPGGMAR